MAVAVREEEVAVAEVAKEGRVAEVVAG